MIPLRDCKTAAEVFENRREVRARLNAAIAAARVRRAPPPPPPELQLQPELQPEPEPQPQPQPQPEPPEVLSPVPPSTIQRTVKLVGLKFGIEARRILSPERTAPVAQARFAAIHLVRELLPKQSLPWIGRQFGGRDHTTVLNALASVQEKMADDPGYATLIEMMLDKLRKPRKVEER